MNFGSLQKKVGIQEITTTVHGYGFKKNDLIPSLL